MFDCDRGNEIITAKCFIEEKLKKQLFLKYAKKINQKDIKIFVYYKYRYSFVLFFKLKKTKQKVIEAYYKNQLCYVKTRDWSGKLIIYLQKFKIMV